MKQALETQTVPDQYVYQPPFDEEEWPEWEELTESERWQREAKAEQEVMTLVARRDVKAELRKIDELTTQADRIVRNSNQKKINALREACVEWVGNRREQLIVFTEFKDTLDYLRTELHRWGFTTAEIHGGMTLKERRKSERDFWNGKVQVLVATEAAGEGINLQCCHVMLNFDIPWNPCRLEQRMGRIHRYGQQADRVYVFNLVAVNTMEGAVKAALLRKMEQMRADLGDTVFNVVGEVLWGHELRKILERIALGDTQAVDDANALIERAASTAEQAISAERGAAAQATPLDVMHFRQQEARFRAHRLSPEIAEKFFRQAMPFVGGALEEFSVRTPNGIDRSAFQVSIPFELFNRRQPDLRLSFWPEICTDDETEDDPIFFIAPGHWLLEALLDRVIERCASDVHSGAIFFDLQPDDDEPYLVWFVHSHIRDGLDRRISDLLAAVKHRADEERVQPLATEVLNSFEPVQPERKHLDLGIQARPMLAASDEVINQCIHTVFLPELESHRKQCNDAIMRDRSFLEGGLTALADAFSSAALEAYSQGKADQGNRFEDRRAMTVQRLNQVRAQMEAASHLLLVAPEVLGVALVIPAPMEVVVPATGEAPVRVMHQDRMVEEAAMHIVMEYEKQQGRHPRDVSRGHSWDIESDNLDTIPVRYIEVKGRGPLDANQAWLTEPEWEAARRLGDQHWLYIVRLADSMMWMIQNPYEKLQPKELKRWIVNLEAVSKFAETAHVEPGTIASIDSN